MDTTTDQNGQPVVTPSAPQPITPSMTPPPNTAPIPPSRESERVGFGKRFGAALLDGFCLFILILVIGIIFGVSYQDFTNPIQQENSAVYVTGIMFILYGSLEALTGASLGKRSFKIKIQNEDKTDAPIEKLILRFCIKNIGSITSPLAAITSISMIGSIGSILSLIVFLGCFAMLSSKKQALHDILAKTAVYNV